MKAGVHLRLSQQLALTPQLQQSIRLLQLSTLELNQEIEQALQDNPLLERDDDPLLSHARLAGDGSVMETRDYSEPSPRTGEVAESPPDGAAQADDGAATSDGPDESSLWSREGGHSGHTDDDSGESPQDWVSAAPSLREHLRMQMVSTVTTPRDRALMFMLIDAIDDNGYLGVTLEELAALCGEDADVEPDELQAALRLLQSFDPPGVGARSVAECMTLQLQAKQADGAADDAQKPILDLAKAIVGEHLHLLASRDFNKLRKLLNVDDDQLRAAHRCIRGLNPHPGVGFGTATPDYVVPDILVRRVQGRWVARLNPDVVPRLRVNQGYAAILKTDQVRTSVPASRPEAGQAATGGGDWATRLQDARWLIRNLRQRFLTIERVAQAIVDSQSRFFTYGAIAMRPLVLREIAATLDLHESTISRVTSNKYMATPFGVFELRYFFGSHVATETGGEASSTAIRALIKQLIEAEIATNPLSDSRIAELLADQGMVVARRTVAKYREQMHIPPASLRKGL